jgi:hypothetical protein
MPAIGAAPLPEPSRRAARLTAIALAAVAIRANPKHRAAVPCRGKPSCAEPLRPERPSVFAGGLDKTTNSWQFRTSFVEVT